jgi:phosphate transport system substrate-binding protein
MRPLMHLVIGSLGLGMWLIAQEATTAADSAGPTVAALGNLAIIVNHRNSIGGLTLGELRRIFMLETQFWPHGRRITLVLREEGQDERVLALRLICKLSEADYRRHVMQELFRGRAGSASPRSIRSAEGMRAFVFNAPGAIGHVRVGELDDSVKALRIEGLLPTDPGYRLVASPDPAGEIQARR